jgi:hypothetical protein
MNYDVPSWGNLRTLSPKNLSNAAADAIAYDRRSQRFFDADAESVLCSAIGAKKHHKLGGTFTAACAINGLEFGPAYQPRGAVKTLRRTR